MTNHLIYLGLLGFNTESPFSPQQHLSPRQTGTGGHCTHIPLVLVLQVKQLDSHFPKKTVSIALLTSDTKRCWAKVRSTPELSPIYWSCFFSLEASQILFQSWHSIIFLLLVFFFFPSLRTGYSLSLFQVRSILVLHFQIFFLFLFVFCFCFFSISRNFSYVYFFSSNLSVLLFEWSPESCHAFSMLSSASFPCQILGLLRVMILAAEGE